MINTNLPLANVEATFKLHRLNAADWANDWVLEEGEPGIELDTGKLKIGDGSTTWSSLPYTAEIGFTDNFTAELANHFTNNIANSSGSGNTIVSPAALQTYLNNNYLSKQDANFTYVTKDTIGDITSQLAAAYGHEEVIALANKAAIESYLTTHWLNNSDTATKTKTGTIFLNKDSNDTDYWFDGTYNSTSGRFGLVSFRATDINLTQYYTKADANDFFLHDLDDYWAKTGDPNDPNVENDFSGTTWSDEKIVTPKDLQREIDSAINQLDNTTIGGLNNTIQNLQSNINTINSQINNNESPLGILQRLTTIENNYIDSSALESTVVDQVSDYLNDNILTRVSDIETALAGKQGNLTFTQSESDIKVTPNKVVMSKDIYNYINNLKTTSVTENGAGLITSGGVYTYVQSVLPTIPTNISAFNNDSGYLTEHQSLSNYVKKTRTINSKALSSNIVLTTSDITNDSGYVVGKNSSDQTTNYTIKIVPSTGFDASNLPSDSNIITIVV